MDCMKVCVLILGLVLLWTSPALAQTTQPAGGSAALELRATEALNRGDYASALAILKKLAADDKDQPQKLGSINEQIRVCERNLAKVAVAPAPAPVAQSAQGGTIPTSPETRKPHPAPKPAEMLEMSIKELGKFDYDAEKG